MKNKSVYIETEFDLTHAHFLLPENVPSIDVLLEPRYFGNN